MTARQASDALASVGLNAQFQGKGRLVVDQAPAPHETAPKGSTVTVYMGRGVYC
jgi:DNA-binding GntR family transcriptional regulator